MDWPRAASIYDRRQTSARRHWQARQSLFRRQMIHGARAVMFRLAKHDDRRSQWLKGLAARRGFNRGRSRSPIRRRGSPGAMLTRKEDIWPPHDRACAEAEAVSDAR